MLVSAPGGLGHLSPVLALAGAARDGGHDVRVVVSARDTDHVRHREFDRGVIPPPSAELEQARSGAIAWAEGLMAAGRRAEGDRHYVREVFGRLQCEVGLPVLRDEIAAFAPDLVLTDPFQSAAVAAAILADVPLALTPFGVWEPLSDLLEELVIGAGDRHRDPGPASPGHPAAAAQRTEVLTAAGDVRVAGRGRPVRRRRHGAVAAGRAGAHW